VSVRAIAMAKAWQRKGWNSDPMRSFLDTSGNGDENDSPLRLISNMVSDEPPGGITGAHESICGDRVHSSELTL
jgi:hypothetical protein